VEVKVNISYSRNIPALSLEENNKLENYSVCVIGCGGIGGYVIEMLGRIGIGKLIVVDNDAFEESNLNRQILSSNKNLGNNKAIEAKKRLENINHLIKVIVVTERFTNENGKGIIKEADVVVDALDNLETRLILEKICEEEDKIIVHGAISGWYGQVSTIFPGDKTLSMLYEGKDKEVNLGNPPFTPALIASIAVSEVIKILINRGQQLRNKVLLVDLLNHHYEVIETTDK